MTDLAQPLVRSARDPATYSPIEAFIARVGEAGYQRLLDSATANEQENVWPYAWEAMWCRPSQRMPEGSWRTWILRAGRGFGKDRAAAEAIRKLVDSGKYRCGTIIGRNPAEARDVMVEGPSGILGVHPEHCRPGYEPSKRLLTWPNGAIARVRSADDPDSIRGLNSDWVWADECASFRTGSESWDQAMLGNRMGDPKAIISTTPRPLPWLKALEAKPSTVVSTGSTYENLSNLAPAFIELVLERYEGTRLGAQELHAQYLEDVEGAFWRLATIEAGRFSRFDRADPWRSLEVAWGGVAEAFGKVAEVWPRERRRWVTVVGVDPPGETAECGIVVVTAPDNGTAGRDHAVVLADRSLEGPPEVWGPEVAATAKAFGADLVVVESNQGGDMTRSTIHGADSSVAVEKVRAKESKADRAEPVSVLYAKGWVHHLGHLPKLEDQCCGWVPAEGKSPDRIDALVHAVTFLLRPDGLGKASLPDQRAVAGTKL